MTPRRNALRWVLGLLAVPTLLALWIGSLFLRAHQILEHHRLETKAFLETFPDAVSERPAIFDPPEAGDAWALEVEVLRKFDENLPTDDPPALHRFIFSR